MQLKDAADSLYFVHHGLSAVKYDLTQASERAVCLCVRASLTRVPDLQGTIV